MRKLSHLLILAASFTCSPRLRLAVARLRSRDDRPGTSFREAIVLTILFISQRFRRTHATVPPGDRVSAEAFRPISARLPEPDERTTGSSHESSRRASKARFVNLLPTSPARIRPATT